VPFRHVVMFQWADDVDENHVDGVRAALDNLPEQISQVRQYVHGSDVGVAEGNFDYVLVADFDTVDDWRTYRDHPAHQLFIAEHIVGKIKQRAAVQYQTPGTRDAMDVAQDQLAKYLAELDDDIS